MRSEKRPKTKEPAKPPRKIKLAPSELDDDPPLRFAMNTEALKEFLAGNHVKRPKKRT